MIILIFFLIILLVPILIGYVIFRLIKHYSQIRYAKYFAIIYSLFLIGLILSVVFEDELFSKNDATELVEDLNFKLNDDFELIKNESFSGIGDYYHTFILEISDNDKNRLINEIKSSPNFMNDSIYSTRKLVYPDRHKGKKTVWNYQNKTSYVREYFQPNGEGSAPTNRIISLDRISNELRFDDIDD